MARKVLGALGSELGTRRTGNREFRDGRTEVFESEGDAWVVDKGFEIDTHGPRAGLSGKRPRIRVLLREGWPWVFMVDEESSESPLIHRRGMWERHLKATSQTADQEAARRKR